MSKPAYRSSPKETEEVKRQVIELLQSGIIRPSHSPRGPLIQKKDGSLRVCIDYRLINKVTIMRLPLPSFNDLMNKLWEAKFFSSLDLQSGYHQFRIFPDKNVEKTAFA